MIDTQGPLGGPGLWAIALDGGTSNTRARLMRGGRAIATARRSVGVRDTMAMAPGPAMAPGAGPGAPSDQRGRLFEALRAAIEEVARFRAGADGEEGPGAGPPPGEEPLVAAGMLSSEAGIAAVPHVPAPAGIDQLARALRILNVPEISDRPIHVVPGVSTPGGPGPDGWFASDIMRGEECETLGARAALRADGRIGPDEWAVFLWPGSHAKLVEIGPDGKIARGSTTMSGELLEAAARHTLLARSLPPAFPERLDLEAAAAGARAAESQGAGRAAFLVRIAALEGRMRPDALAAFWIGASVAEDARALARSPVLATGRAVWVGGRAPLRALYVEHLGRHHRGPVVALPDAIAELASAWGACAVLARSLGSRR